MEASQACYVGMGRFTRDIGLGHNGASLDLKIMPDDKGLLKVSQRFASCVGIKRDDSARPSLAARAGRGLGP
jgi:hypothetical protein